MDNKPFYSKLYADIIRDKYPEKELSCLAYLSKENWTALDVIEVNEFLFGSKKQKGDVRIDRKHRSYDTQSICQILRYQQNNKLNNNEVARTYGVSRNTIAKWKTLFLELHASK